MSCQQIFAVANQENKEWHAKFDTMQEREWDDMDVTTKTYDYEVL